MALLAQNLPYLYDLYYKKLSYLSYFQYEPYSLRRHKTMSKNKFCRALGAGWVGTRIPWLTDWL